MKKILILATDYPTNEGSVSQMFIHIRCQAYIKSGINLEVLNFSADNSYIIDDVKVITLFDYWQRSSNEYDILILHAPNIRNHMKFLNNHGEKFEKFIFFFHGHEILKINKTYPKHYPYNKQSYLRYLSQDIYDTFKLSAWTKFFNKEYQKTEFVFVSNWMKNEFIKEINISSEILNKSSHVIYNAVNHIFTKQHWNYKNKKEFDLITIRSNWDDSKYCIDIVNNLANSNPKLKFLLIGKGDFFKYNIKAKNITLLEKHLNPTQMPDYLNKAKCALMPTRLDSQGLMSCEMATFGIPVITSNLDVCKEVFTTFNNIVLIDNEQNNRNLNADIQGLEQNYKNEINERYFEVNTVDKEIELIYSCLQEIESVQHK